MVVLFLKRFFSQQWKVPLTEQTGLVIIWISFSRLVDFSEPDSLCSQDLSGKCVGTMGSPFKQEKMASGEQKEEGVTDSQDLRT